MYSEGRCMSTREDAEEICQPGYSPSTASLASKGLITLNTLELCLSLTDHTN